MLSECLSANVWMINAKLIVAYFLSEAYKHVRSLISYAAPAWFPLLSDTDKIRLEKIQRTATRAIIPDMEYEERLCILQLPYLSDFLMNLSERHFNKIACDNPILFLTESLITLTKCLLDCAPYTILSVPGRKNVPNCFFPFLCIY